MNRITTLGRPVTNNGSAQVLPYVHQPLNTEKQQIRLLKIIPSDSGPINCTIAVFDLDTAPPYSALSYTWGPPHTDFTVSINGRILKIRKNLFRFLETFRRDKNESHRYLWIDQICIAQSNIQERNHQVGLMSTIYNQSDLTIVWLCDDEGLYPLFAKDFICTGRTSSFAGFMKDAYFRRLWVVQEILLASNVWILTQGNVWVPWKAMRDSFNSEYGTLRKYFNSRYSETSDTSVWKALINPEFDFRQRLPDLGWCILNFSGQECEDPRDKVYGLLGLVSKDTTIVVDYKKTKAQVYVDACIATDARYRWQIPPQLSRSMGLNINGNGVGPFRDLIMPFKGWNDEKMREQAVPGLCDISPVSDSGSAFITSIGFIFEDKDRCQWWQHPSETQTLPWICRDLKVEASGDLSDCECSSTCANPDTDMRTCLDIIQTVMDFHHRLDADRSSVTFVKKNRVDQMKIVEGIFWTAGRASLNFEDDWVGQWCFGYQGNVYRYPKNAYWEEWDKEYNYQGSPDWDAIFGLLPDPPLMRYLLSSFSSVETIPRQPSAVKRGLHVVQCMIGVGKRDMIADSGQTLDNTGATSSAEYGPRYDRDPARKLYSPSGPFDKPAFADEVEGSD